MVVQEFITAPQALILDPFCAINIYFFSFSKTSSLIAIFRREKLKCFFVFFLLCSFLFVFSSPVDFLAQD